MACQFKKKSSTTEDKKKRFTEQETCINPAAIEQYLNSTQRKELLQYAASFDESMKLTNSKYSEIRAVLIGEIVLRNAQRTGVVCGMRVSEVENGERVGKMKYKVVVFEHKTGKIKPAVLFLDRLATDALLRATKILFYPKYVIYTRLKRIISSCPKGKPINQQIVQNSITQLLNLSGIKSKITPTDSAYCNNNP